jgi:hypothetical protein
VEQVIEDARLLRSVPHVYARALIVRRVDSEAWDDIERPLEEEVFKVRRAILACSFGYLFLLLRLCGWLPSFCLYRVQDPDQQDVLEDDTVVPTLRPAAQLQARRP